MADFRRILTALAVLVVLAGLANAQPFSCQTSFVRPILRAEGLTELIGDIVFDCTGVTGPSNLVNFTVFTDARITSRTAAGTSGTSEALLLINDPGSVLNPGPASLAPATGCTVPGVATCTYNVFRGVLSAPEVAAHSVTFLGVPVVPTGTNVRFRITNIRINASDFFGAASSGAVVDVNARLSISPSEAFNFEPASGVVGRIQASKTFALIANNESITAGLGFTFRQCVDISGEPWSGYFRFRELFGTAFKAKVDPAGPQTIPGVGYNSESGLQPADITAVGSVADQGTRLRVTFTSIPKGVAIFVSNGNIEVGANSAVAGAALLHTGSQTAPFVGTGDGIATAEEVTLDDNGNGVAIWEVFTPVATAIEDFDFGFYFEATANPQASPATGVQGTVTGNYAPTPTNSATAASWANAMHTIIPRFVDPGTSAPLILISVCKTNLLFPYVLGGVGGFDTGIAITNTSTDPFDTTPQSGTCTLNFYGVAAPAAFTTTSVGAKTTDAGVIWSATAMGLAQGFNGYIIAQCNFQYAHGFAFVSDIGAHNIAMGYLALILPDVDAVGSRPNNGTAAFGTSETLSN